MAADLAERERQRLLGSISKRGPDGSGTLLALDGRVGFVHSRLAVIDPAPRSNQPFVDPQSGAFISFNGEIYNFKDLRGRLAAAGAQFVTESDTEVLLKGYVMEGVAFFNKLRGMYAFAIFDPRTGEVVAARDPSGIKPLYLEITGRRVGFGSSPDAASRPGDRRVDPAAAVSVAVLGGVLEPLSPYLNVSQLMAGSLCKIKIERNHVKVSRFAVAPEAPWSGGERGGADLLEKQLSYSVEAHFQSDVPVAVFQSAGLDSTIISTIARRLSHNPMLMTVGFADFRGTVDDEVPGAAKVARVLGLEHRYVYLTKSQMTDAHHQFLEDMQTPTADAFNTYLAARLCRSEGVKVALSGVGGDELFAGYSSFRQLPKLNAIGRISGTSVGRAALETLSWGAASLLKRRSPKLRHSTKYLSDWSRRYLLRRAYFVPDELCEVLDPAVVREGLPRFWEAYDALSRRTQTQDEAGVRALETDVYMRNILLRDADWAGMAHGVEIRTPLVDVPLYRSLCDSADRCAYRKEDLRILANKLAPALQLAVRPKTGFTVPRGESRATPASAHGNRAWNRTVLRHWFGDWVVC